MASTSLTLGPHWEAFIREEVASGRYATASEVVRAGLRELEERGRKLEALRAYLDVGIEQARRGEFGELEEPELIVRRAMARLAKRSA